MKIISGALLLALLAGCSSTPKAQVDAERAKRYREQAERASDPKVAIELYTKSLQANSQVAEVYFRRGNVYVSLHGQSHEEIGMSSRDLLNRAAEDFSRAIDLNPVYYEAHYNRAMIHLKFSQYRDGVRDLIQCTAIRSKDPEPHELLGKLYEEKFEDRQVPALEHYEKYVDLGGMDEGIKAKVKEWRELKKSMGPGPTTAPKAPTADDEKAAEELHKKVTGLIGQGKKAEAIAALEELQKKYGHTKYAKDRLVQFNALMKAFKPENK